MGRLTGGTEEGRETGKGDGKEIEEIKGRNKVRKRKGRIETDGRS